MISTFIIIIFIHIRIIDDRSKKLHRSPTEILFDEWGTSGRKRATVSDLLSLLVKGQLYRAADFVATDILNTTPPKRPETGPGAWINIALPPEIFDEKAVEDILNNATYPNSSQLVGNFDSILNNNNRDFNNSVSVDHVKVIHDLFPTSSGELTSDFSETESQSDLIVFSARTITNDDSKNDTFTDNELQSNETPIPVFSAEMSNSYMNSSMTDTQWSDNIPKLSNICPTDQSESSKQYSQSNQSNFSESQSIDSEIVSSLIPDFDDLQVRDGTKNTSKLLNNDANLSSKMSTETYIPNLPLFNGNSS